jgi:hypothetical protein
MKKVLLTSLILGLMIILSPFTTRAQDDTEMAWARHIKKAIDNRPNPEIFSEKEAWQVLLGENTCSQNFTIKKIEFKNFYLQVKTFTKVENYSRSSTSSVDGWWYTRTLSFREGVWEINWIFAIQFSISIILIFISIFFVKKYYYWASKRLEGNSSMRTPLFEIDFFYPIFMIIYAVYDLLFLRKWEEYFSLFAFNFFILFLSYTISKYKIKKLEK